MRNTLVRLLRLGLRRDLREPRDKPQALTLAMWGEGYATIRPSPLNLSEERPTQKREAVRIPEHGAQTYSPHHRSRGKSRCPPGTAAPGFSGDRGGRSRTGPYGRALPVWIDLGEERSCDQLLDLMRAYRP